jgi:hypothetical protein
VIPRYTGDVVDPRGGIRHVIPKKGNYLAIEADQQRLIKGDADPFLPHLILHMDRADTCDIAVFFLLDSRARCLLEHLKDFLARGGKARILVSDYLDLTEPVALRRLNDGNLCLKAYETHTKAQTDLNLNLSLGRVSQVLTKLKLNLKIEKREYGEWVRVEI